MNGLVRTAAAILVSFAGGCGGGSGAKTQAPTAPPRVVRTAPVTTIELPRTIAVTGVLAPREELILGMQVGGRLQTLAVDVGDTVEPGALLAAMDPRDFELERDRASAAVVAANAKLGLHEGQPVADLDVEKAAPVLEAQATVREATVQRERVVTMVQEELSATAQLQTADATLAVAQSRLQAARDEVRTWIAEVQQRRVELTQANKRLHDATVHAPWRGRVAARHVAAGQVLAAGEPIVTLVRVDPMRLRLQVPDRLASEAAVGQTVEFTVDGRPGEQRSGRVARIGAAIDRGSRTLLVEAEVANADGALLPAAFCRARIVTAPAEPVIAVPRSSIVSFAGVDRVFTVETVKDVRRAKGNIVQLGRQAGDRVEVVQGIAAGAEIVVDAVGLAPGTPVTVE